MGSAHIARDAVLGASRIEHIRSLSTEEQRSLHVGIASNGFAGSAVGKRLAEITGEARALQRSFGQSVDEALHATHDIRVRPFRTVSEMLPRAVRDIADETGKLVRLAVEGDDVQVDGMVLDGLRDPLLQLVRNAVDHGIEPPEVRRGLGKDETGTIALRASIRGDHLMVELADDGGGIDVESVRAYAVTRR